MRASTEITLRAMRFHALVGILPHERMHPQPIEIDLVVTVGDGDAVVDYRRLYEATASVIASGHIDFLEDIAEQVATGAFEASDRVTRARVAIRKPHVALNGPLAYAEVRIDRLRQAAGG
ncbi:MAG TPA: dihydroneopterin aldolase [Gemmatimonadaceae bacterium]|nr:dihydroneopterin aldolase [Gemmatimonadaceae bacterium]